LNDLRLNDLRLNDLRPHDLRLFEFAGNFRLPFCIFFPAFPFGCQNGKPLLHIRSACCAEKAFRLHKVAGTLGGAGESFDETPIP
jgi:hypothetical protein